MQQTFLPISLPLLISMQALLDFLAGNSLFTRFLVVVQVSFLCIPFDIWH
jgi:hypothetical protein